LGGKARVPTQAKISHAGPTSPPPCFRFDASAFASQLHHHSSLFPLSSKTIHGLKVPRLNYKKARSFHEADCPSNRVFFSGSSDLYGLLPKTVIAGISYPLNGSSLRSPYFLGESWFEPYVPVKISCPPRGFLSPYL